MEIQSSLEKQKAGEMAQLLAQPLKALATVPEDQGSTPSTRIVTHNHLGLQFQRTRTLFALHGYQDTYTVTLHDAGKALIQVN